jgi:ergothioneine biosynthesis protein EgtB
LKYTFAHNPLFPVYKEGFSLVKQQNSSTQEWVDMPEGLYGIGHEGEGFCWDNELGRHKVYLPAYAISNRLVTNGEFLAFIEDGGYEKHELWHDEAWALLKQQEKKAPLYWHLIKGVWHQYTLEGLQAVDMDDILCHISYYEAWAFARWKGLRLPTEFEWEAACDRFEWGVRWEWTNSAYLPYPGYKVAEGALGEYNGKFMVNQMVLRGASTATPQGHERRTYRNFFQTNLQWQCTGIRLAK